MKLKDLMLESLTHTLEDNEHLLHPIYGSLRKDNRVYNAFFAFTEYNLLVVLLSNQTVAETLKIPLSIESSNIKKSSKSKQYTIGICFNDSSFYSISAYADTPDMETNKENLSLFLHHLSNISPKQTGFVLEDIEGEKIRRQFFTIFVYGILAFLPMAIVLLLGIEASKGQISLLLILECIFIPPLIILPFGIFSALNKSKFGKIVCVMNEKGLYTEKRFVPWEKIKTIKYNDHGSNTISEAMFKHASVEALGVDARPVRFEIIHFPLYGLKVAKKHSPHINIKLSEYQLFMIFLGLIPTIIAVFLLFKI